MIRSVAVAAVRSSLAAFVVIFFAASSASAGTISSWQGSTAAWSLNGNWVGGAANKPTTSGTYSLVFSGTPTSTTSNNVGAVNIDSILFGNNGSAGQTAAFTIGSGNQSPTPSLTLLNGATITTTASVSGTL